MATIDNDLSKVKEEHLERLLSAYEARSKEFQRLFGSLVIFALLFLFIILLPYLSLQIENRDTAATLNVLQRQMEPIANHLKTYLQVQNGIQDLSQGLHDSPEELHTFITDLDSICNSEAGGQNQASQFTQSTVPACPNDKMQRDAWFNQKIQEHVQQQFDDFFKVINQEVIAPLNSIDPAGVPLDAAALTKGLSDLQSAFQTKLAEHPGFWRKFEDKVSFYAQLNQELGGVWSTYDAEIKAQSEKLAIELTNLATEKESQEKRQSQLLAAETKISDRLDQIEFPFGKLPIGLTESILIFPLVLSIGFFICTLRLKGAIRTRASIQSLYQQKDSTQQIINAGQISLIAPLPIDPIASKKSQLVQFAVLLVPVVIFMAACGLNLYGWTLPAVDSGIPEFKWMYGVLYVLGLALFIYTYQQILTELRYYGRAYEHSLA